MMRSQLMTVVLLTACSSEPGGGNENPPPPEIPTAQLIPAAQTGASPFQPKLAVNDAGVVLAAWTVRNGHGDKVVYALNENDQWSAEGVIAGVPCTNDWEHECVWNVAAATDGDGFAVAWAQLDGLEGGVYAAHYDGAWSAPQLLGSEDRGASRWSQPRIVSNGDSYAVFWAMRAAAHGAVFAGGEWTTTVFDQVAGTWDDAYAELATNGTHYAAIWRDDALGYADAYFVVHNGNDWSYPVALDPGGLPGWAGLASNGNDFVAAWGRDERVYLRHLDPTGAPIDVTAAVGAAYDIEVAGNAAGNYAVVWRQYDGNATNMLGKIYSGGAWSATEVLDDVANTSTASYPAVAGSASGFAAMWSQNSGGAQRAFANSYTNANGWDGPVALSAGSENVQGSNGLRIESDGSDGYIAAWLQQGAAINVVAAISDGNSWGPGSTLQTVAGRVHHDRTWYPDGLSMVGADGRFIIAWSQGTADDDDVLANTFDGGWGTSQSLASTTHVGSSQGLRLIADSQGALAAWVQHDGQHDIGVYTSHFRDAQWQTPARLPGRASVHGGERDGDVTMLSDGHSAAVAYLGYDTAGDLEQRVAVFDGVSWGSTVLGTTTTIDSSYAPRLVASDSGVIAVWGERTSSYTYFAATHDGSTWSSPVTLDSGMSLSDVNATLVARSGDRVAALWRRDNGAHYNVRAAIYHAGAWGAAEDVDAGGFSYLPNNSLELCAHDSGEFIAAWVQSDAAHQFLAARYTQTAWQPAERLDLPSLTSLPESPHLGCGSGGAAALWLQRDSARDRVYVSVLDGAGWSTATALDDETLGNPSAARLAATGAGFAAVWLQDDTLWASIWAGGSWSSPAALNDVFAGGSAPVEPRVAATTDGDVVVAWRQHDGDERNIYITRFDGEWSEATAVDESAGLANAPVLTSLGDEVTAGWTQFDPSGDATVLRSWAKVGF